MNRHARKQTRREVCNHQSGLQTTSNSTPNSFGRLAHVSTIHWHQPSSVPRNQDDNSSLGLGGNTDYTPNNNDAENEEFGSRNPLSNRTNSGNHDQRVMNNRKSGVIVGYTLFLATTLATFIINAAIAIFGMGVGVGLILGDTLRTGSGTQQALGQGNASQQEASPVTFVTTPATPTCRARIHRMPAVSDASIPQRKTSATRHSQSIMPAQ